MFRRSRVAALAVSIAASSVATAQVAPSSNANTYVALGDLALFQAFTPETGEDLWRTDGTAAGTFSLELCPGPCAARIFIAGAGGGKAFFVAGPPDGAQGLFVSDGTAGGTRLLLTSEGDTRFVRETGYYWSDRLVRLYFKVHDDAGSSSLWTSDGTVAGTRSLGSLTSSGRGELVGFAETLTATFVLAFDTMAQRYELLSTDGTPAGTGGAGVFGGPWPLEGFATAGSRVIAVLRGPGCGTSIWSAEPGLAPTEVASIPNPLCRPVAPGQFFAGGGLVFFVAADLQHSQELWRTDGSAGGTFRLTDLTPERPTILGGPKPPTSTALHDRFYFSVDDGVHGFEVWTTDGTIAGTHLAIDLCPGTCSGGTVWATVGGRLLIGGDDGSQVGYWSSDGTTDGSEWSGCPGACQPELFDVIRAGGVLFVGDGPLDGAVDLWRWLPEGDFVRLTEFQELPLNARTIFLPFIQETSTAWGSRLLFTANDGIHFAEPWLSDGTPGGTRLLRDIYPPVELPPPPAAPTLLSVEEINHQLVRVVWQDNSSDEVGFQIEVRPAESALWGAIGFAPANATSAELVFPWGASFVRVGAYGDGGIAVSNELSLLLGECEPAPNHLCLGEDSRFRVQVQWRNQHAPPGAPQFGNAQAVPAGDDIDDSGYFWFFTPDNLELVVKVLDGTSVNGHFWFFWGALSDVEYTVHVEDTVTRERRTYHNPPGQICGGADTTALPVGGFAHTASARSPWPVVPSPTPFAAAHGPATRFFALDAPAVVSSPLHPPQPCVPDDETLCLLDGELSVTVDWTDQHNGGSGTGHAVPYTDLSGFFWFFHPENIELVVKALDGRTVNGKIWVFYGGLSDVGYSIRVAADAAHQIRTYDNPPGTICGRGDTAAF